MRLGPTELLIIAGIVLLLFGGTILRRLGRNAGATLRELRGVGKEIEKGHEDGD